MCCRNSRLVVDEDDNGKFRLERVNPFTPVRPLMAVKILHPFSVMLVFYIPRAFKCFVYLWTACIVQGLISSVIQ